MTRENMQKKQTDNNLRRRAEESLGKISDGQMESPDMDTQKLIHELRVHQVELEMQNEELRQSQAELESSRKRYLDLYDFAPIGYFTLDEKGFIQKVNLTGAGMLGYDRAFLKGKGFSEFVAPESQDEFYLHRKQTFANDIKHICELKLINRNGAEFHVQLQSVSVGKDVNNSRLRIAAIDITERVRSREELKRSHEHLEQRVEART
ncbi:MAG: PAS domain S-box protein, partial [Desulfonatronovibrio sp.]